MSSPVEGNLTLIADNQEPSSSFLLTRYDIEGSLSLTGKKGSQKYSAKYIKNTDSSVVYML